MSLLKGDLPNLVFTPYSKTCKKPTRRFFFTFFNRSDVRLSGLTTVYSENSLSNKVPLAVLEPVTSVLSDRPASRVQNVLYRVIKF